MVALASGGKLSRRRGAGRLPVAAPHPVWSDHHSPLGWSFAIVYLSRDDLGVEALAGRLRSFQALVIVICSLLAAWLIWLVFALALCRATARGDRQRPRKP
jgi:hypothetical protein